MILITVDCLRTDNLQCIGYAKNITPTIDDLAKNGILLTNAMANASNTSYSVSSFLITSVSDVLYGVALSLMSL